jgi:hypothetical protein
VLKIEGREPLDWRDENHAILDETKVRRIYTQRFHLGDEVGVRASEDGARRQTVTSSVTVAAISTGDVFSKGRDFPLGMGWCHSRYGLETAQISKRGNR